MNDVTSALHREIYGARERDLEIVHVRVTTDALPGSVTTTMIAPERLRLLALRSVPDAFGRDAGVVADPSAQERWREILVHPADWAEILKERPTENGFAVQMPTSADEPTRVFGIPVGK